MVPTDVRDACAELAEKPLQGLPPGEPAWLQDGGRSVAFDLEAVDHGRRVARVGRDGEIIWAIGEVGHADAFAPTAARLEGVGPRTELYVIGVGTDEQRGVFDLRVRHLGRHTESAILAKRVLLDRAHRVYNGVTKIERKARKSSGGQTERLLLHAFLDPVIARVPLPAARDRLVEAIEKEIGR